jgi:hypothetical protein
MNGRRSLLPVTRLVLIGAAAVQLVTGLEAIFAPDLVHGITWPPPFEPVPPLWLRYDGAIYLAMALGAAWALWRDEPPAARGFLVIAVPYVAAAVVITLVAAVTPPGIPPIAWLYVVLGGVFVALGTFAWSSESRGPGGGRGRGSPSGT